MEGSLTTVSPHPQMESLATELPPASLVTPGVDRPLISWRGWCWIAVLGSLFAVLHRTFLWRMVRIATGEWGGDWSHAMVVPLISVYFITQNRSRLASATSRVYLPGLVLLFGGILSFAWCIYPVRNDMFQGYSMIVGLFGLVLFLLGPAVMRTLWFPILYLALGVKISQRIWEQIAWQLQLVAAKSSTIVLQMLGVDASVTGSTIELAFMRNGQWVVDKLNVAEACSGLRMLMAFVALGAAMAYLVPRAWWQRLVMVALAVPIAVMVNIGRVTAIGLISMVDKEKATGDFHVFVGMLMLIPAAGMFMLVGWVLDRIIVYDGAPSVGRASKRVEPVQEHTATDEGTAAQGTRVLKGFLLGGVLTIVMGLEYGVLLAINRPEDLFGGRLTGELASGLSLVGLLILALGFWCVHRMTRAKTVNQSAARLPALGVAAGVLLAAVVGLNGVVGATRIVLIKQSVPVRRPLFYLPERVGTWEMVHEDPPLSAEALEALGTKQYISRAYQDLSWPTQGPEAYARLHVAYYTGTPDTVPHVADRCYVAGGVQGIGTGFATLELTGPGYRKDPESNGLLASSQLSTTPVRVPSETIDATIFSFAQPDSPSRVSNVLYFFVANGKVFSTPEWVRAKAFDLRDRYSYYCKVEVGMFGVGDTAMAAERAEAFLSVMLPEIMACLPDWVDVIAGRWPASQPVAYQVQGLP